MATPHHPGRPPTLLDDPDAAAHDVAVTDATVAALALGLSYAGLTGDEYAAELAQTHCPEVLRSARQHLHDAPHLPPAVVAQAGDLLDRAIGDG